MPHPPVGYLMETLHAVLDRDGPQTARELCDRTGLAMSTVHGSLVRMLRRGMATRERPRLDRWRGPGTGSAPYFYRAGRRA